MEGDEGTALHSERRCPGTCLLPKSGQHFLVGLEGRKEATAGASGTALKGPEETWGSPGCQTAAVRGARERSWVCWEEQDRRLLARLLSVSRLGWGRMTGVS